MSDQHEIGRTACPRSLARIRGSLEQVPTAILSRHLSRLRLPAIPYCLDLIGARSIEVNQDVGLAFRPDA